MVSEIIAVLKAPKQILQFVRKLWLFWPCRFLHPTQMVQTHFFLPFHVLSTYEAK